MPTSNVPSRVPDNTTAQSGDLTKCKIYPRGGEAKELKGVVPELKYYENLLNNSVTCDIVVSDSGALNKKSESGLLDGLPIRGGEKVEIEIADNQKNKNKIKLDFYVNRIKNSNPTARKDVFMLDLCSLDYIRNEQTRVVKKYEGTISDHVTRILKEVLKTTKDIEADPTGVPYNFIGNERKPFYICTWLASKSAPTQGIGGAAGYFFYETADGYKFKSIDVLNSQGPKRKLIYTSTEQLPAGFDAKILNVSIERDMDLQQNLNLGVYSNRTVFFDFFNMDYKVRTYGVDQQEPKLTLVGEDLKYVAPEFRESPSRFMTRILDIGYLPSGKTATQQLASWKGNPKQPTFDAAKLMVQALMRYNQLYSIKYNITIAGDFSLRAGDVLECAFPDLSNIDINKPTNKQTTGKYIIASLCHRVTANDCFTSLTLVRDSFSKESVS